MKHLIAICAIGNDRTGLVYDLTRVVVESGGNVLESRMTA
ncbi:MAG: ACT domain-containing protein, partial [Steroidobacteraceae bacterium]